MPLATPLDRSANIAVLRALQLGDLLCSIPALRALRRAEPEAHVALIGLPWAQEIVDRFPSYLDELIPFAGYPGMPERPFLASELPPFLAEMQEREFDLAIQLHGSGFLSNGLVASLGATRTAGFYVPGTWRPDATYIPYPDGLPEPERHLALMRHLGAEAADPSLEFPVHELDHRQLHDAIGDAPPAPYAVVHPGARDRRRRWRPERFAEVADHLLASGLTVVLTGTSDETDVTAAVRDAMRGRPLDLAGRLTLGATAALLESADLLISNDTGISHLAAATRTPSVVVFVASDPARWAPLDRGLHRVVGGPTPVATRDHCCLGEDCASHARTWAEVDAAAVIDAAMDTLGRRLAHAV